MGDAAVLLSWRNDPETRKASLSSADIVPGSHEQWLFRTLQNPDVLLLVASIEGSDVGTLRFNRGDEGWHVSWTMAPEFRGKGLGKAMLAEGVKLKPGKLYAQIRADNAASLRMASFVGFQGYGEENGVLLFFREPVVA